MSVVKSQRKMSNLEYVYNARQLEIYTLRKCINFPKRHTFYLGKEMSELAINIYKNVHIAYSTQSNSPQETKIRHDCLLKALLLCKHLAAQLSIATEMIDINFKHLQEWSELIDKEIKLLHNLIYTNK